MEITEKSVIAKPTLLTMLKTIPSGVALDVAKNHTGVVYWDGEKVNRYGFSIDTYDKSDPFAEYKMRRQFKDKLTGLLKGLSVEYCVIEDVYGGENFDTVRKLLALQTVVDELIFEHVFFVKTFFRWNEPKWSSLVRTIYKQRGRLKAKIETQGILEFLEDEFFLTHKDDTPAKKREIFFEDICDATGILLAVVVSEIMKVNIVKASGLKLSDVKMFYISDLEDTYGHKDRRIREEGFISVELDFRALERSITMQASQHPDDVLCALLPSKKLGVFGVKHGFTFYDSEESYLVFYYKKGGPHADISSK